jgi:ubiquitin carboxyl-terminal hydrolase 34
LEAAERTDTQVNATLVRKAAAGNINADYRSRDLIESVINNYLFPDLSEPSETEIITPRIPIMHEETREELYHILVLLCKQVDNYTKVVDLMSDLIPHGKPCIFFQMTTWALLMRNHIRLHIQYNVGSG